MKATAFKPPGQSMNAEQNKDDRHHYSAKEAAALMRQPLFYPSNNQERLGILAAPCKKAKHLLNTKNKMYADIPNEQE